MKKELEFKHERKMKSFRTRIAHEVSIAIKFDVDKNHLLMSRKLINTFSSLKEGLKI